jgi:hypothetical protein
MSDAAETIEASGRRIGQHAWVEMRLFETLGAWSAAVVDPRARALLANQSHHHAWHAELWHDLLPALPHLPAADLVGPADSDSELVASLAALDPAEGGAGADDDEPTDAARLAAVYEQAMPRLQATYEDHLAHTRPVTDGPTIRALRLVLTDLDDDTRGGLDLLDTIADGGNTPDRG